MNPMISKAHQDFGLKMTLLLVGAALFFTAVWLFLGSFPTLGDVASGGVPARKGTVSMVVRVRERLQVVVKRIQKASPVLDGLMLLSGIASVALPVSRGIRRWGLGFAAFSGLINLAAWLTPVLVPWLAITGKGA